MEWMRRHGAKRAARGWASFAAALLALACAEPRTAPRALEGRIDLSRWDFSRGSVDLAGTWSVCWGQLLPPGAECPSAWESVRVRGLWSDGSARSPFGGKGVATYRLRLELPEGEARLSLRAGAPMTAYRLWIDGQEEGGAGVVGTRAETTSSVPRANRVFSLPRGAPRAELWVQLANFEFRGGGIRRPWIVGRPDEIQRLANYGLLRDALLCAVSLVVGVAYLVQFGLRRRDQARGYFGLFALVMAVRAVPASISDFTQLVVPWASFAELTRIEYLGTALAIFSGAGFFQARLPGAMPPRFMWGVQLVALALAVVVLLAPFPLVLETLPFFLVLPPAVLALVIACYGRAWWRGMPGVGITLAASLVFLAGVTHDVIRTSVTRFGFGIELFPYLLTVWLLAEAYELARAFVQTFERVESLSEELTEANFELQETESSVVRFVPFDFLRLLGKRSIRDVKVGDHAQTRMSVLYGQVHSFERLRETLTPEAALRLVNDLVARWEPQIYQRGGFVSQYLGEGVVALFPGGPDDAVAAALGILEAARVLDEERAGATPARPPLELGIGIDTGELLLGTIGGDQHLSSGVVGAAVHAAQRLAALTRTRGAKLLITAATRDGLADASRFVIRETGGVALEEGSPPVPLYEVRPGGAAG
jgi:class 3 adenylate cyclase